MANKTETFTKKLKVTLTDDEKVKLADEMADANEQANDYEEELDQLDKQFKADKADLNAKITACNTQITSAGSKIRSGYEHREVECERYFDYDAGEVIETRTDTGEEVKRRKMTESELQVEMDFIDGSEGDLDQPEETEETEETPEQPQETAEDGAGGEISEDTDEGWPGDIQALARVLADTDRCSTNNIRRGLHLGYQEATKLMERAEELGIIGPPKGAEPREILMDLSEWATPQDETDTEEGTEEQEGTDENE